MISANKPVKLSAVAALDLTMFGRLPELYILDGN